MRKGIALTLILVVLFSFTSLSAMAGSGQDANLRVDLAARRPLIGNPRGTATLTTRTAGSQAIRGRVTVLNSNGTITEPIDWNLRSSGQATGGLPSGTTLTTREVIGSTRSGTVRGDGQRRTTSTGSWSVIVRVVQDW